MTEIIARSGAWLMQQAAALPDTVVVKPVVAERGWFEIVTGVADVVATFTLLALSLFLAPFAVSFWRTFIKARVLIDRASVELTPLARQATGIAENMNYITRSLRSDVEKVNAAIAAASDRLHHAADITEKRLNEFSALLEVAQEEAERVFVSTAAAVRGVRAGAAALGDLAVDGDLEEGGFGNGDDDEFDDDGDGGGEPEEIERGTTRSGSEVGRRPARPRVHSRARQRD